MPLSPEEQAEIEANIRTLDTELAESNTGPWVYKSNIEYGNHPRQRLDAIYPTTVTTPLPSILLVHGGAWAMGDKAAPHYQLMMREFAKAGFACFSTNYRLTPESTFPAMVKDVAAAAQFIAEHAADRFQCQPGSLVAMGSSAGGHLAALVGLAPGEFGYQHTKAAPMPFRAVSCIAAPLDFRPGQLYSQKPDGPEITALFGRPIAEIPDVAILASPISHVHASAPPFLFQHNQGDPVVDVQFSLRMHEALLASGIHSELEIYGGDTHGLHNQLRSTAVQRTVRFVTELLAGESA